jgi:glycosyltransferase involved in cell wall biosynthesis
VATVSFLSNDAAFLSFPNRNLPVERPPEGRDEVSITRQLRSRKPFEPPVPIPMATGASVLVSSVALGVVGPFEDGPSGEFSAALADFCFRGRQRGFVDLLETTSFCSRPSDIAVRSRRAPTLDGLTGADSEWIRGRHPEAHAIVQDEVTDRESPLGLVVNSARAKVMGLRVLIDGTILGPHEMGTQVTTVAMIEALAARDDVREVCVALPGPIPAYARQVLTSSKVRVGSPADFDRVDIAHRPFQPNEGFDAGHWREHAERVVVTVHDLISFHIGTYSGDPGAWRRYRQAMRESLRHVDGVIVVSEDVGRQLQLHRMPAPAERVFVVANGTEHLTGDESARQPDELFARGFAAGEFLLCLGTNYTHKNRDLAIRAFQELRRRGHDLALVLAGPSVPWGSSRVLEARAYPGDGIFVLAEVTSTERNWLVRHAGLILYATSAEGFGLVPYEAARFGTPTVNVGFGPLIEVGGDPPVLARDWEPQSLADAAEALLLDPALARRQVASCLKAGAAYTWGDASERLVEAYRTLLARPPVR